MSIIAIILYAIGALLTWWLGLFLINMRSRYRHGAALACAAIWPALAIAIIAFLLLDLGEWGWLQLRRRLA